MEETRILVVDDEQEIADLLELYLISDGYQVIKSGDALEGLAIMEREKIDLVLLDIMMPDMSGYQFCELLCRRWMGLRCAGRYGRSITCRLLWSAQRHRS